jgi:hypothetical protein
MRFATSMNNGNRGGPTGFGAARASDGRGTPFIGTPHHGEQELNVDGAERAAAAIPRYLEARSLAPRITEHP